MTSPATANRTGHGVDRSRHFETRRLWPAVFLAAVLGALFWRVLFMGEGLAPDGELVAWHPWADVPHATAAAGRHAYLVDQFAFFSPNEEFISRSVRRGFWPLWNPEVAHGLPTVASTQNAEYYPTNLLLWALPPFWTRGVRAILRLVACLAGTYAFGRASGMRRGGATFAALTFGFCGFNMIMLNWPITNVTLVLPCILWALERTFVTGGFASGVALALATGAALLGGHPPTVLHITVAIVAWTAYRLAVARADRLPLPSLAWRFALCAAAAALIGSATLLPWREYFAQNPGAMLLLRQRRVLSWKALVSWVVPDFFGRPAFPAADWTDAYLLAGWENYVERTGYVGIAGLLLAVRGVAAMRPWHRALPWLATLAISLPIIYNAPVLGQLPHSVPVVSWANNTRMLSVACFALAMLAGGGCDALLDRARPLAWAAISWLITCVAFGALLMALWPSVQVRQEIADAGALAAFTRDAMWPLLPAATVVGCTVLARHARKRLAFLVLFTVAAFDLGRIGIRFNPTIPLAEAAPATAGIRYLERAVTAGRILPIGVRLLPGNTMLRYGVPAAQGGDWVNIRHYEFLLTGSTGHYDFGREFRSVPETWRALNVTHLVVPAGTSLPPAATLSYDDELRVVPLADAMPRATIVHAAEVVASDAEARALIAQARVDLHQRVLLMREDAPTPQELPSEALTAALRETERVDVTDDGPNSLRVGFHASAPGFLVLTEPFLPGWTCELDGAVIPILRANIAFRAIRVPPGEHVAVFTYRPQSARYGIALAAGTLGTIAGMAILRRRRARRRC